LYRDSCLPVSPSAFVKDLSKLGRDLSKTLIVDNSIHAFGYHLKNGIPIPSFYGQHWDNELQILVRLPKNFNLFISE
jgi:CTD small phosphatase-like protein 2